MYEDDFDSFDDEWEERTLARQKSIEERGEYLESIKKIGKEITLQADSECCICFLPFE